MGEKITFWECNLGYVYGILSFALIIIAAIFISGKDWCFFIRLNIIGLFLLYIGVFGRLYVTKSWSEKTLPEVFNKIFFILTFITGTLLTIISTN